MQIRFVCDQLCVPTPCGSEVNTGEAGVSEVTYSEKDDAWRLHGILGR